MDLLNKHVQQSPFGSVSHFASIGSSNAGSHTSNSLLLEAQSQHVFVGLQQSHSATDSTISIL